MSSTRRALALLVCPLLWLPVSTARADTPLDGPVTGRVVLKKASGPYSVKAPLFVAASGTLELEAGTVLRFATGVGLRVEGRLLVHGAPGQPVSFVGAGSPEATWRGITLLKGPAPSRIAFATVVGGGTKDAGAVTVGGGTPSLEHVSISGAPGYAVHVAAASAPLLSHLSLAGNVGGVLAAEGAAPVSVRLTWWGAPEGPSFGGVGSGVSATGAVLYEPWLGAPPGEGSFLTSVEVSAAPVVPGRGSPFVATLDAVLAGCEAEARPAPSSVLKVHDSTGTVVAAVESGVPARFAWDGTDASGLPVPPGAYLYELLALSAEGECGSTAPAVGRVTVAAAP